MKQAGAKGFIGVVTGVFGYLAGCSNEIVVILALFIIMDYVLGIIAALIQGREFDSRLAIRGAAKKVLYAFVIVLGYLGDYLILFITSSLGIKIELRALLGVAVTLYLIGTEGFSISRNLVLVGVPVPEWLYKFFGLVKDHSGKLVQTKHLEGESDIN